MNAFALAEMHWSSGGKKQKQKVSTQKKQSLKTSFKTHTHFCYTAITNRQYRKNPCKRSITASFIMGDYHCCVPLYQPEGFQMSLICHWKIISVQFLLRHKGFHMKLNEPHFAVSWKKGDDNMDINQTVRMVLFYFASTGTQMEFNTIMLPVIS